VGFRNSESKAKLVFIRLKMGSKSLRNYGEKLATEITWQIVRSR